MRQKDNCNEEEKGMKKKKIVSVIAFLLTAVMGFALASCDLSSNELQNGTSGKHTVDPNGMGGEGILDDGGAINPGEPQYVPTGIKAEGEHQIVLGEDEEYYELVNTELATWSNSGYTTNRVRNNGEDAYTIFTLDISDLEDVSKVGVMVTLIHTRPNACIWVSSDRVNWEVIGYEQENLSMYADYAEHIDDLRGQTVSDSNLYQCYYALGEYAVKGQPLYVKCGYSEDYNPDSDSKLGADIIDYISWYEVFEFVYEWI